MPKKDPAILKKVSVNLPFGIGSAEWEANTTERTAAWSLYIELVTRIALEPLDTDESLLRYRLNSLYSLFATTRQILKEVGPDVGSSHNSVGGIAIAVLNRGLRPFLSKWHPRLQVWEAQKPANVSFKDHELKWIEENQLRSELKALKQNLSQYAQALAEIAQTPIIVEPPKLEKPQNFIEDLGNGIKLEMIAIPGGEFWMGTDDQEIERLCEEYDSPWFRNEEPIHLVMLKEFYIGKYPITQAQYEVIMGNNPSKFKGENNPVEKVSWYDAQEFCHKLSEKSGKKYKLPSEAEWEYACRAGSKTRYCFGDDINQLSEYGWYADNSGDSPLDSLKILQTYSSNYFDKLMANNCRTRSVGQKKANKWGLYDMHGNVWEWCEDDWHDNYENAPDDGTAWIYEDREYAVRRGGSWYYSPNNCRSAFRNYRIVRVNDDAGFRVVCKF